jgi:DNA polymerase elongation subunit (family B)
MSPIKVVNVWKQKMRDEINIDMGGVSILDYYNVYRWYGKKLERYSLEYVSQKELGKGKLENPYGGLNEMAEKDWNMYTEYNAIDCERVHDLENKLGYIRMIQALSLLCKCPMKFYNAQTQLIEGLMLTYYRRNKLVAPHFYGGERKEFVAAHVKDPDAGLHEWVVDIDITSSYPSHIIALNMSLETFMGKISGLTESQVVSCVTRRKFDDFKMVKFVKGQWEINRIEGHKLKTFNKALDKGLLAIAPNGAVFHTGKEGVVAEVERTVFFKRKEVKGKRDEFGKKADVCEGLEQDECKERERELDSLQLALKIMMNAFFGIISVPYSRYFNIHIASAITACGRHTIKMGEKFCNELLNNPNLELQEILNGMGVVDTHIKSSDRKDYVKYIDTDSLFVALGDWITEHDANWNDREDFEKIDWIKKISAKMEEYIDERIFHEVQLGNYNSQVHDFKIGFKQEIIAKSALFVKKKKYSYHLVDKEGFSKDELCTTGLEIVRSDSAEAIRPRLKEIMEMIVKQEPDAEISAQIRKCKKGLMQMSPEDLAANVGINNIRKYITNGTARKGTPWHVKGVNNYRILLKSLDISDKYEDIYEGLKAKVIYVKKNPFDVDVITFHEWPEEFNTVLQYDQKTMIEKFFINKIRTLLEPIKKEYIIDGDDSKLSVFF